MICSSVFLLWRHFFLCLFLGRFYSVCFWEVVFSSDCFWEADFVFCLFLGR